MPEENFTSKEIWDLLLHPSEGEVAKLYKTINKLCKQLATLESDLKKYNGLHNRFNSVEEMLVEQIKKCNDVQIEKAKCAAVNVATESLREELIKLGRDEERERFERAMKIIGAGVLLLTTATGLVTWFLNIW